MNGKLPHDDAPPPVPDAAHLALAWDWVLRLREDTLSQDDLIAWLHWYEADERNKEAFEDMQAFWEQAERVAGEPGIFPAKWRPGAPAPAGASSLAAASRGGAGSRRRFPGAAWSWRKRSLLKAGAVFAAGASAVLLALAWMPPLSPVATPPPGAADATASSLVKEAYLPDGSSVELASKSQVSVQYTEKQRLLEMQNGEAYFTVAHNRNRPFIVRVGPIDVRAVGTAFNIRRAGGRVVVTVVKGIVDVYPADGQGAEPEAPSANAVRVKAGSEVVWNEKGPGPTIASVDASHALAWREGRLDYINEPLAAAISDINRYSSRHIVIRDDAVGRIVFSGTVLTDATDAWIRALPGLFPIVVQNDANGDVVLSSRPPASPVSRKR